MKIRVGKKVIPLNKILSLTLDVEGGEGQQTFVFRKFESIENFCSGRLFIDGHRKKVPVRKVSVSSESEDDSRRSTEGDDKSRSEASIEDEPRSVKRRRPEKRQSGPRARKEVRAKSEEETKSTSEESTEEVSPDPPRRRHKKTEGPTFAPPQGKYASTQVNYKVHTGNIGDIAKQMEKQREKTVKLHQKKSERERDLIEAKKNRRSKNEES
jgi:hypothetical protein